MDKYTSCPGCGQKGTGGRDVFQCSHCHEKFCQACQSQHVKDCGNHARKVVGKV